MEHKSILCIFLYYLYFCIKKPVEKCLKAPAVECNSQKVFKGKGTSTVKGVYFTDYKWGYPVSHHYML